MRRLDTDAEARRSGPGGIKISKLQKGKLAPPSGLQAINNLPKPPKLLISGNNKDKQDTQDRQFILNLQHEVNRSLEEDKYDHLG